METFSMETNPARHPQPERYCGLQPLHHMRFNALLNMVVLGLMVWSSVTEHWFSYKGSEYSLTGINLKEAGGWQKYSDFKWRCTEGNLVDKPDYKDDCEFIDAFEFAGIVCLIFLILGMCLQAFNILSVSSLACSLSSSLGDIEVITTQFTHLMGPITYAFAVAVWISLLKVVFLNSFRCALGVILAISTVGMDFGVALHYRTFRSMVKPQLLPSPLMTY